MGAIEDRVQRESASGCLNTCTGIELAAANSRAFGGRGRLGGLMSFAAAMTLSAF